MSTVKQVEPTRVQSEDVPADDEAAVAAYLDTHPGFFERHAELLSTLRLAHRAGAGAVSLIERQVSVLRQRNEQLENQLRELVDVARGNDQLAEKIHSMSVLLMSTREPARVIDILEEQLRMEFSADRSVLVLFSDFGVATAGQFVRHGSRDDPEFGPFRSFLDGDSVRCGVVRDAQRDYLFGADDSEIGSIALIPLGPHSSFGFLAIGSRSADHFHPGISSDFLARLGDLIAAALAK